MYYWGDSVNVHFGAECNNSALKRQILASPYTITINPIWNYSYKYWFYSPNFSVRYRNIRSRPFLILAWKGHKILVEWFDSQSISKQHRLILVLACLFRIISIIINNLEVVRCINVIIITVIQRFLSHHDGLYNLKVKLVYNT